jgi:glycerophosphoryl diester phosphodiesterase
MPHPRNRQRQLPFQGKLCDQQKEEGAQQRFDHDLSQTAILRGGSVLNGNYAPTRLTSEWKSTSMPDLSVGYDPCSDESLERLFGSRDFEGFVDSAVAASPRATMIYLYYPVVIEAAGHDYDIVAAFHRHGRTVDAWTIAALDEASLENIDTLLRCKVDQITTDDPEGVSSRFHK